MNYRLKKEATKFFDMSLHSKIEEIDFWMNHNASQSALEEVGDAYVTYGIKQNESESTLSGWNSEGARFCFTLHLPSVKLKEYSKFQSGNHIEELVKTFTSETNNFFKRLSE